MARDIDKSPFPGMDPYLEPYWGNAHTRFLTYSCDMLLELLPPGQTPRLEERTTIEDDNEKIRVVLPDVRVDEIAETRGGVATSASVATRPIIIENLNEPVTERFIEIFDPRDKFRVVTVIEFMSPTNKVSHAGRQFYLNKQAAILNGGINLVEIDLIRVGRRNLRAELGGLEREERGMFYACVTRGHATFRSEVYPIKLKDPLPNIGIPLRVTDTDLRLDLQTLFEKVYKFGAFGRFVDYAKPLFPPLPPDDAKWALELLAPHFTDTSGE